MDEEMTITKRSWLDVPRWCNVIHYDGNRKEDIIKFVLLSCGVKTWQKDIEINNYVQDIDLTQYITVDKDKVLGYINAKNIKEHKDLIKAVKIVNKVGLKVFVDVDLDKEGDKCLGHSHIAIRTTDVDDKTSTVNVHYKHLKYGEINKEYILKHDDGNLELIHVKEQ